MLKFEILHFTKEPLCRVHRRLGRALCVYTGRHYLWRCRGEEDFNVDSWVSLLTKPFTYHNFNDHHRVRLSWLQLLRLNRNSTSTTKPETTASTTIQNELPDAPRPDLEPLVSVLYMTSLFLFGVQLISILVTDRFFRKARHHI